VRGAGQQLSELAEPNFCGWPTLICMLSYPTMPISKKYDGMVYGGRLIDD
jgi:hypothetical protein